MKSASCTAVFWMLACSSCRSVHQEAANPLPADALPRVEALGGLRAELACTNEHLGALAAELAVMSKKVEEMDSKAPWWVDRPLTFLERLAGPATRLFDWFKAQPAEAIDKLDRMIGLTAPVLVALLGARTPASAGTTTPFPSAVTIEVKGLEGPPARADALKERVEGLEQRLESTKSCGCDLEALAKLIAAACSRPPSEHTCRCVCRAKPDPDPSTVQWHWLDIVAWPFALMMIAAMFRLWPNRRPFEKDMRARFMQGLDQLQRILAFRDSTADADTLSGLTPNATVLEGWNELKNKSVGEFIGGKDRSAYQVLERLRNQVAYSAGSEVTPEQAREYALAVSVLIARLRVPGPD